MLIWFKHVINQEMKKEDRLLTAAEGMTDGPGPSHFGQSRGRALFAYGRLLVPPARLPSQHTAFLCVPSFSQLATK